MLRLIGIAVVIAASIFLIRAYAAYLKKGEGACQGFLDFLGVMQRQLTCYLEPIDKWISEYRCESLEAGGFLEGLRAGGRIREVFESARGALYLPKDAEDTLYEYFSRTGSGYIESELRAIAVCIERLREQSEALGSHNEKNKKALTAVTLAVAMGLILLIL